MNTITLNNNIQMPMLGFGTFLMGGAECKESVLTALRSGYRMIDSAEAYGNEEAPLQKNCCPIQITMLLCLPVMQKISFQTLPVQQL